MDLYMFVAAFAVYVLFTVAITSSRLRVAFVVILFALAAGNVVVGGIQFFKGHDFMPLKFLTRGDYGFRASGFYGCPNHLAGFLEIVMLFALSLACWGRWRSVARIITAYVAIVCMAGILMTGSRGGYASSLAGILVFSIISLLIAGKWLRRDRWYFVIAAGMVLVLALTFSVRSIFRDSQMLQFRVESASADAPVRLGMWKAAIRQFQLNPVFGTGSGTYLFYGRQFRDPHNQRDPIYAHNDYLQLLAEFGIAGLAGALIFLGVHVWTGWRSIAAVIAERVTSHHPRRGLRRSHDRRRSDLAWRVVASDEAERQEQVKPAFKGSHSLALTTAALASLAAYSVHSFVDFNLHIPANTLVLAFVLALLAYLPGSQTVQSENGERTKRPWTTWFGLVLPAIALSLAVTALPTWPAEYFGEKARRVLSRHEVMASPELARQVESFANKALHCDSKNPEIYYFLGESQVALADMSGEATERNAFYASSVDAYRKALELVPQDVRFVLCLAWSLDALNRFDEAELALQRAFELDPNSVKVWNSYADHLRQEGVASHDEPFYTRKFDEAEAALKRSIELAPESAAAYALQQVAKDREAKAKEQKESSAPSVSDATPRDE
jgi:O-antigen ligase/cytochrome c-type biogenesis protein CcmH/NrfG